VENEKCYDLDELKTIVKITGKLKNETPLRIGYGKSQSFIDQTDNPIPAHRISVYNN